jgi:hypothetical protein
MRIQMQTNCRRWVINRRPNSRKNRVQIAVPTGAHTGVHIGVQYGVHIGLQIGVHIGLQIGVHIGLQIGVHIGLQIGVHIGLQIGLRWDVGRCSHGCAYWFSNGCSHGD